MGKGPLGTWVVHVWKWGRGTILAHRQRGRPPILEEITEAIGLKSCFGAFRHVRVPLSGESV